MSLEILEQLESKVQTAVDTITLLQMELDEFKQKNQELEQQNRQMRNEHEAWQQRVRVLLDKMESVE